MRTGVTASWKPFFQLVRQAINIGAEKLKVIWPGAGFDNRGPREDRAEVLPMMALLFPDAMVAALMREVERVANDPLPQAERKKRIAELEAEISELAYVEEALVAAAIADGEDVQRSPSAPPQAVLQVRVAGGGDEEFARRLGQTRRARIMPRLSPRHRSR